MLDLTLLPLTGPATAIQQVRQAVKDEISKNGGQGATGSQPSSPRLTADLQSPQLAAPSSASNGFGALQRVSAPSSNGISSTNATGTVQLTAADSPHGDEQLSASQKQIKFSDLVEAIEERVLWQIERRGGRYRGLF